MRRVTIEGVSTHALQCKDLRRLEKVFLAATYLLEYYNEELKPKRRGRRYDTMAVQSLRWTGGLAVPYFKKRARTMEWHLVVGVTGLAWLDWASIERVARMLLDSDVPVVGFMRDPAELWPRTILVPGSTD